MQMPRRCDFEVSGDSSAVRAIGLQESFFTHRRAGETALEAVSRSITTRLQKHGRMLTDTLERTGVAMGTTSYKACVMGKQLKSGAPRLELGELRVHIHADASPMMGDR